MPVGLCSCPLQSLSVLCSYSSLGGPPRFPDTPLPAHVENVKCLEIPTALRVSVGWVGGSPDGDSSAEGAPHYPQCSPGGLQCSYSLERTLWKLEPLWSLLPASPHVPLPFLLSAFPINPFHTNPSLRVCTYTTTGRQNSSTILHRSKGGTRDPNGLCRTLAIPLPTTLDTYAPVCPLHIGPGMCSDGRPRTYDVRESRPSSLSLRG